MTDLATVRRPGGHLARAELLTADQVAAIVGQPAAAVAEWAGARRIRATTRIGQTLYPAALVRHTHAQDTRVARNIAAALRLRRFIRTALTV